MGEFWFGLLVGMPFGIGALLYAIAANAIFMEWRDRSKIKPTDEPLRYWADKETLH